MLHNSICLWISDCYWLTFYAISMSYHVSEFVFNKFVTSVICDLGWPRIPREPFLLYYIGHGDSLFIIILVYFKLAWCRVNHNCTLAYQVRFTLSPYGIGTN